MATKPTQHSPSTDLGRLWMQAIKDYNARTGKDLSAMGAQNMAEVMKSTDAGMKRFKGFRDDGSKMSRFRSSIGNHLGDIQKCIDGMAAVGCAAGAFPPAMPVGLVFTAASRLISVRHVQINTSNALISTRLSQVSKRTTIELSRFLRIQLDFLSASQSSKVVQIQTHLVLPLSESSLCNCQYVHAWNF